MRRRHLLLLPLLSLAVGCLTEKRTYQVTVQNKLQQPITVWLVKEHGPVEPGWYSPEQVAESNPLTDEKLPDVVVPPGKTANQPPIEGEFERSKGRAYLRIFSGTPTLTQMLAISRDSLTRLDLILEPEAINSFTIENENGFIHATRLPAQPIPPPK